MKRILLSLVAIATISLSSFGQAPEGFKYQAVVRDAGNTILNNQAVGMRMSIQQGSIGGTTVYQETFSPTTNGYGLVNLEIGSGTVVSGDFTTIDWSAGPYFIETAVDLTGGTSYAVMGTSELMSVPYALHANTAENVTNDLVDDADADPTNEIQTINRAGTTVTLSNGGGTFEDSVGVYTAGTGIDITNNVISTTSACGLAIGDTYAGGIIFFLDGSGCHGLVAKATDESGTYQWSSTSFNTWAFASGIYGGAQNTKKSIARAVFSGSTCPAASVCDNLTSGGYTDWYLPSKDELDMMYVNLHMQGLGGFGGSGHWSSTEGDNGNAWNQVFNPGFQVTNFKDVNAYVRAVRAF
jgi:hypothetical protein